MRDRSLAFRGESGVSVIEMVLVVALFAVIMIATYSLLDSGTKAERGQQARHDALVEARESMTRITRDLRQALVVRGLPDSTTTKLTIKTLDRGEERWVVFEVLGNGDLVRRSCENLPCTGGSMPLATGLDAATPPFCYDPQTGCLLASPPQKPSHIRISLAVEPAVFSGGPITLTTDVRLRNI